MSNRQHSVHSSRLPLRLLFLALAMTLLWPGVSFGELRSFEASAVKVRSKQSPEDMSHDYFVNLLRLAMEKTEADDGPIPVIVTDFNPTQGRALFELMRGRDINVDWAGTSRQSERDLRPIRIPLIGGLLGYRIPVINRSMRFRFTDVRSVDDLKRFLAVQGEHWPDSDILENAGLRVYRTASFSNMYKILAEGRVDYFPRGVNEVYAEVKKSGRPELMVCDSFIIAYTMPMYFFTSKKDEALAQRIETGLRRAIADGSFRKYMETHPATAPMFPLSQFDNAVIIRLPNRDLPEATPTDDPSLWLRLGKTAGN